MVETPPEWYDRVKRQYAEFMEAVESLGAAARNGCQNVFGCHCKPCKHA